MFYVHESRQARFRRPFGARPKGSEVYLAVESYGWDKPAQLNLHYGYGLYDFARSHCHLTEEPLREDEVTTGYHGEPRRRWSTTLRLPGNACLFFYYFEIVDAQGQHIFLSKASPTSDAARMTDLEPSFEPSEEQPDCFQITVHEPGLQTPDWAKGALMYQIFPDRFKRDRDFDFQAMTEARPAPERIYHRDWEEEVDFEGRPEEGYLACDFFGGSLKGIEEELPYLASMGVEILYLNPIFQARSNHRYDAADYRKVDPILGTTKDFRELCGAARERGIRIILDIALSHTGADSLYFNRYGRFPEVGAWQDYQGEGTSPYASWYKFSEDFLPLGYESWWGFPDLPDVNEHDLSFREAILGEDGVLKQWLRLGASGFRLDVSDELPDDFLLDLYATLKAEDPEIFIVGEVWEDASNKHSYGSYRDFALGRSHDSFMGYPFREAVLEFLTGESGAELLHDRLETIRENYPPEIFACQMNLLGSHDVARFLTAVSGVPDPGTRALQQPVRLDPETREEAERKLALGMSFQALYPGMPSLYYGDEVGMEGFRDPFNRRTFPWDELPASRIQPFAQELFRLRQGSRVLRLGAIEWVWWQDRLLIWKRCLEGEVAWIYLNSGAEAIALPELEDEASASDEPARPDAIPGWSCVLQLNGETLLLDCAEKRVLRNWYEDRAADEP